MDKAFKLTALELATIISALLEWRHQLMHETHDPEMVDEAIGTLTPDEIGELIESAYGE